jgi:hypothetical protein
MTIDSLSTPRGREMRAIYGSLESVSQFPCAEPTLRFDVPPAPTLLKLPAISLPCTKVVSAADGAEIDSRVKDLQRIYKPEFDKAQALNSEGDRIFKDFAAKKEAAVEAAELMSIRLAHQKLIHSETAKAVSEEFHRCKRAYEQERERQLNPIKHAYEDYSARTKLGIESHFDWALRTLALPLPSDFPWSVFYDPQERILQVNQRVPFLADIVVKRSDGKRALAKRDADNFLRHIVPAISLYIAQHVAINDIRGDVDTIAVNCWCRYFERTSGKLKNAFLSSLKVEKEQVIELNINKADALDAFRALRGVLSIAWRRLHQ